MNLKAYPQVVCQFDPDAIVAKMAVLPAILCRTLTWDQGREMANHAAIAAATDLDIYFCDPHSPWQRGSNETPTACSANTLLKAPIYRSCPPTTSTTSPCN